MTLRTANHSGRHGKRGFTLVELLVVIVIIAILAALLFPVLSSAKNRAARATDLNNLRQVMIAMHVYTGDNHDSLPWPNWDYGKAMPDGKIRPGWLYTLNPAATGPAMFAPEGGLLWNTLKQPKSYLCPMDKVTAQAPDQNGALAARPQQLSSYIMNGAVIGFRSGHRTNAAPVKTAEMLPGDCLFFEGDETQSWHFNDGSSWPSEGVTARHSKGATQAALDGSAGYVTDDAWAADVIFPGKNRLLCNPNAKDGGDPINGHVLFEN
jgi:prepilin-type N-terminal cleavage/methylation domain-containing protein